MLPQSENLFCNPSLESELFTVDTSKDNHSPGPVIREADPLDRNTCTIERVIKLEIIHSIITSTVKNRVIGLVEVKNSNSLLVHDPVSVFFMIILLILIVAGNTVKRSTKFQTSHLFATFLEDRLKTGSVSMFFFMCTSVERESA